VLDQIIQGLIRKIFGDCWNMMFYKLESIPDAMPVYFLFFSDHVSL